MDPFEEMAALGRDLDGVKAEEERLAQRRAEICERMKIVAARMTGTKVQAHGIASATASGSNGARQKAVTVSTLADIGLQTIRERAIDSNSRVDQLLAALRERPEADYGWLSEKVYGANNEKNRANIASLFSKAARNRVIRKAPGKFVVKESG